MTDAPAKQVKSNMLMTFFANTLRTFSNIRPGYFSEQKHNHYADFGFPTDLQFSTIYGTYTRNSLAKGAVQKTTKKTWQDYPSLLHTPEDEDETEKEAEVRKHLRKIRFWQKLAEADSRALVGGYAGLILRFADGKAFDQEVGTVKGIKALVEVIPAWRGQLEVKDWDTDTSSETYGQPLSFTFNEASVDSKTNQPRSFTVHRDRVLVLSEDGTVHGRSFLEPGYNDLMTIEKIVGSCGQGFWKNAKSAPVITIAPETDLQTLMDGMDADDTTTDLYEKFSAQIRDWNKGFDESLIFQGMDAKLLQVSLPSPEHFFNISLQSFAASTEIPLKILVGSQTGERASTEDAKEWAQTCQARRTDVIIPVIDEIIDRFKRFKALSEDDWEVNWSDLTESDVSEKMETAGKMAEINAKHMQTGELVFTSDEIRAVTDRDPLTATEALFREEPSDPSDQSMEFEDEPEG